MAKYNNGQYNIKPLILSFMHKVLKFIGQKEKEGMLFSTTVLIILAFAIYIFFYHTYGKTLERDVVKADNSNPTPAHRLYDGVDYVPAVNRWVLFGHHFASIAGAAPIVGPAIAMAWGFVPALLWIWFGNVFIGAVHDYLALSASMRHDGKSIQWIAGKLMSERTGKIFEVFILFLLILVVAAFSAILGNIFHKQPAVPSASLFFIIDALIVGTMIYRLKINLTVSTIVGLLLLAISVWLGLKFPILLSYKAWLVALLVYIVIASVMPVWVLLQPRDYLNAYILWFGLFLGGIALLLAGKKMVLPAFTSFSAPVINGKPSPFWPLIPLIIACGSLSGFHSLVGSGTTSKQIDKETDALLIGYGGMFTEGFLSTIVVLSIGAFGGMVLMNAGHNIFQDAHTFSLKYLPAIKGVGGPVGIFAKTYAEAVSRVFHLSKHFIEVFASLWVAAFALTTLDTTNRIGRYVISELADPLKNKNRSLYSILSNRWVASLIPAILGILLAWGGAWQVIWPAFGGANQMLASITLLTASLWVYKELKVEKKYTYFVLIPALFLWLTVTLALLWYLFVAIPGFFSKSTVQAIILIVVVVGMLILNFLLIYDFRKSLRTKD